MPLARISDSTSRVGITVVAVVIPAFLRLMLRPGPPWTPDPPCAIASVPKIADFCGIPLEIGDRAGLAARARSRLAGFAALGAHSMRRPPQAGREWSRDASTARRRD